ncbi:MAG: hypothetical protein SFY66_18875 [Oculatellaceae cyanobacterium bins.114]|nr:hypothetical protein [Oculatellaceae cyanobacterium bins.114]
MFEVSALALWLALLTVLSSLPKDCGIKSNYPNGESALHPLPVTPSKSRAQ